MNKTILHNIKRVIIRSRFIIICLLCVVSLTTHKINAQENVIKFTSLEWPPFSGKDLRQEGAFIAVVRAAYEAMGYKIEITFLPWIHAQQAVKDSDEYAGYLPAYESKKRRADSIISEQIVSSPVGFAQHSDAKISWSKLDDLKKYRIGIVSGYVNSVEFDKMVKKRELNIEENIDDATALRKLVMKRLDLVVIDRNVMNHILKYDETLKSESTSLSFNKKILENKKIYVAFRKSENGMKMNKLLEEGLKKVDVNSIINKYMNQ
ncbi:MAG: amino acid ABC transporter substrate-binding protein [Proteobacteria bacterium]|nr:amino acid ABC transporter substrate-binding protein [Pseudomonadota bacterium]